MILAERVAVTGATGQVGAAILHWLHDAGLNVVAVARNGFGAALIHAQVPDCEIRVGSTIRGADGRHLVDDCGIVVNCALASSEGNPRQAYVGNRVIVDDLLQGRSLRWLIHFSSVAVYGDLIRAQHNEQRAFQRPRPQSEYGRSKLGVERYVLRSCRSRQVRCTVLRLGHVYGAGIGRSREIIELSRDPSFRLPYDGRYASNAIHVDRLAAAVLTLLSARLTREVLNLAERMSSWRDVFDWHTDCLGLVPAAGMTDADSDRARRAAQSRSVAGELAGWVCGLPVRRLVRSPAIFDLALQVLALTPISLTKRVADVNRRVTARALLSGARSDTPIAPLYVSEGVPGPHLELPSLPDAGPGSMKERSRDLQAWHRRWSEPNLGPVARSTQPSVCESQGKRVAAPA